MAAMPHRHRAKVQKTAAYAASQPLFNALRVGVEKLDKQLDNLTTARDIVQKTHVKLVEPVLEPVKGVARTKNKPTDHQQYIDAVVEAWRAATDSYLEIFRALADVTAAEPSEGKGEREGHQALAEMMLKASESNEAALEWQTFDDRRFKEHWESQRGVNGRLDGMDVDEEEEDDSEDLETSDEEPAHRAEEAETVLPDKAEKTNQQSAWQQQMPPQPEDGAEPVEQERIMKQKRELAKKRREEEEAKREAEKQENLRARLAGLEGAGKSRKEREAEVAAAAQASASSLPTNPILMSVLGKRSASGTEGDATKDDLKLSAQFESAKDSSKKRKVTPEEDRVGRDAAKSERTSKKRERRKARIATKKARDATTQVKDGEATVKQHGLPTEDVNDTEKRKDTPTIPQQPETAAEPDPKYQDVSREVAARLAAKEDKTKAAKLLRKEEKKKRHRESRDSLPQAPPTGNDIPATDRAAEKPRKKKVKGNDGAAVEDDGAKEKAKKHARDSTGGEGSVRKRRKKEST